MTKSQKIISWIAQIVAAIILVQTLFFKFSAAPESVYIFSKLGVEPFGRIASGIMELIAAILLIWPAYVWLGAIISAGVISGAILSHLTVLGIDVMGDGGELFYLACIVLICNIIILLFRKEKLLSMLPFKI